MRRILVCEDEDVIRDFVVINLNRAGYDVVDVNCGEDALRVFDEENGNFDIALLDIMMPGIDGFQVCKALRKKSSTLGIIMLSAKTQEMDKVSGLMLGADDYMTKPFEIRELLMRIQAISRRSNHQDTSHPVVGNLSYDPATCEICNTQTQKSVQVSGKEMQLLEFFMNNCNQVLEKNQITTKIWGFDSNAEYNNVEVYVSFLRRKFHHLQVNVTIRAIRGIGYIMEVSDD